MLALVLEPNIMVNSTGMQRVCLSLKSYIVDVDDKSLRDVPIESCHRQYYRVMLVMALSWQLDHGMM
jgi:hypothetical protein